MCWNDSLKRPPRWPKGSSALRHCFGMALKNKSPRWPMAIEKHSYELRELLEQGSQQVEGQWEAPGFNLLWPRCNSETDHMAATSMLPGVGNTAIHSLVEAGPPSCSCIFCPAYSSAFSPLSCQLSPAESQASFQMPGCSPRRSTAPL